MQSLRPIHWIKSIIANDGTIELMVDHAQSRIPEIMQHANRCCAKITSVGLHEPTLEDVFIKYTGRKIRETGSSANSMAARIHMRHR